MEVRLRMKSIRQVKEHLCLCIGGKGHLGCISMVEERAGRKRTWYSQRIKVSSMLQEGSIQGGEWHETILER